MVREVRRPFLRVGVAMLWVVAATAPTSCAKIWGIDDGIPFPDASTMDVVAGQDVTTQETAAGEAAAEAAADTGADVAPDSGNDVGVNDASEAEAACMTDPNWCTTHCGSGPNNCGSTQGCGQCGGSEICAVDAGNLCVCQSDPGFCQGRCGALFDNCDAGVMCNGCDASQGCSAGNCGGCMPETVGTACGSQACGKATNNCGQSVYCGSNGNCANTQDFCTDASTCCLPNNGQCQTTFGCGGSFVNNCGQSITCPSCPPGDSCNTANNTCFCPTPSCPGNSCATISNACGNVVTCTCSPGQMCNAGTNTCFCPTPMCPTGSCGTITNACGNTMGCGSCPNGETCNASNMCAPCTLPSCGKACNTTVSNSCGSTPCGNCPNGADECVGNLCCSPSGCSATNCQDTCGVFHSACCQDAGGCSPLGQPCGSGCCSPLSCQGGFCAPFSDGGGGQDSGGCSSQGQPCPGGSGCCGGFVCTGATVCEPTCNSAAASCSSDKDCCFPLNCNPQASVDGGGGFVCGT